VFLIETITRIGTSPSRIITVPEMYLVGVALVL
jgi:hypothetical protein